MDIIVSSKAVEAADVGRISTSDDLVEGTLDPALLEPRLSS